MRLATAALLLVLSAAAAAAGAQTPRPDTAARDTTRRAPRPIRRQPVTPELERSAFADARARSLLGRARVARLTQDSALRAYDARTYQRLSVGLGVRRLGRERLLLRSEQTARVRWARGAGLWVEPTGRRATSSLGGAEVDLTVATPIPYFPGREALWLPSSYARAAQSEVNEDDLLHPLAAGAEAYYRYATGDSLSIRLPDGRVVGLRELRITARRPQWRAFVGSFWFDVERGSLVRAVYRLATEVDIWQAADEDRRREIQELEQRLRAGVDTGAARRAVERELEAERSDDTPVWVKGAFSPMRAKVSAITVEYGLHDARFWLPKRHVAEGELTAGFARVPVRIEERFQYEAVNASVPLPPVPPAVSRVAGVDSSVVDDSTYLPAAGQILLGTPRRDASPAARAARDDSLARRFAETERRLRAQADSARTRGDTARARQLASNADWNRARLRQLARRRERCASGDSSYYAGTRSRYEGALQMGVRLPCDESRLATSPDLPALDESSDEGISDAEREELLDALGFGLQAGWGPQRPVLHTGLDLVRFNRVEELSVGASATSVLGLGYTARAVARIGTGDLVPNGELSLARSNGRAELRASAFHRLGVANDDFGAPLSLGASIANLLYARDEGFYYRTWGAELTRMNDARGPAGGAALLWRLFAERQRSAGVEPNTRLTLARAFGKTGFPPNIDAARLDALGAGAAVGKSFGADPAGLRLDTRLRAEGAFTDRGDSVGSAGYGRLVADGTLARGLGRFTLALTGAAGGSAGHLPPQRAFYMGGVQTVRGQFPRLDTPGHVGNAFWLGRGELGLGVPLVRPTLFYDVGWAGARADFTRPGRPLSGAGVGLSMLDGLARIDVARGIHPERRWRVDLYVDARF